MMGLKALETDHACAVELEVKQLKHRFDLVMARFEQNHLAEYQYGSCVHHLTA